MAEPDPKLSRRLPPRDAGEGFSFHRVIKRREMEPLGDETHIADARAGGTLSPLNTTSAGMGLVKVVANRSPFVSSGPDFEGFSGEHLLVHVSGDARYIVEGGFDYELQPRDMLFVPAFVGYWVKAMTDEPSYYLSIFLRKREWFCKAYLGEDQVLDLPFRLSGYG